MPTGQRVPYRIIQRGNEDAPLYVGSAVTARPPGTPFTFGLITAVASQIHTCDPAHVPREVDGHIYANDGHTILATLRGSESRILVGTDDIAPIMQQAIVAVED